MSPTKPVPEATPQEIHRRRESGEDLLLIDVREHEEIAIAALPDALICPLSRAGMDRPAAERPAPCHLLSSRDPQYARGIGTGGTRPRERDQHDRGNRSVVYGSGWKRAEVLNACGVMGSGPDRDRPREEVVREV
jgi:hypothetical protein